MTMTIEEYRRLGTSEHRLQMLVLDHIKQRHARNVFAFAIPNAARRSLRGGSRMKDEGLLPGAPDLVVVMPDREVVWLELKNGKGRQSIAQKGVQARLAQAGHVYGVAHTLDEAIEFLEQAGALK